MGNNGKHLVDARIELAQEEQRRFSNMQSSLIEVLEALDREGFRFAKRMIDRAYDSRSEYELRFIMDGMMVIAGLDSRPQP
jgi:hypothetical protein